MAAINHTGFIVASYAAAFIVIGALIVWVTVDYIAQRRRLADLELRGLTRRSTPLRPEAAMQQAKEKA
jgi:heme exporter protein D